MTPPVMDKPKFHSVEAAIRILRSGKKDPRWLEAAQFLIERAAPDVQLMLEAARELERRRLEAPPAPRRNRFTTLFSPLQWAMMALIAAGFSGLMFWLVNQLAARAC